MQEKKLVLHTYLATITALDSTYSNILGILDITRQAPDSTQLHQTVRNLTVYHQSSMADLSEDNDNFMALFGMLIACYLRL